MIIFGLILAAVLLALGFLVFGRGSVEFDDQGKDRLGIPPKTPPKKKRNA